MPKVLECAIDSVLFSSTLKTEIAQSVNKMS